MPDHQSKALALRSTLEAQTLKLSIGATLLAAGLILLLAYAFVGAIASLLSGGYRVQLGPAILYAVLTLVLCIGVTVRMRQQNVRLGSALVRLDAQAWFTSTIVTGALLLAFLATRAIEETTLAWLIPYMDPGVLAVLTLALLPVPLKEAGIAFRDIFGITPTELDSHVRRVMADFVATHGFSGFESYVTRAGRAAFIEISVLVPPDMPAMPVAHFDALRAEIGEAIGEEGPDRWLTIVFTTDPEQV